MVIPYGGVLGSRYIKQTRSADVAKKADRTAYNVRYNCKTKPPKVSRLWDIYYHMTTLDLDVPGPRIRDKNDKIQYYIFQHIDFC